MEDRYRTFGDSFSKAIIAQDYGTAHTMLAPWLQKKISTEDFRNSIDEHIGGILREWGVERNVRPQQCDLDGNSAVGPAELREPDWDGSIPEVPEEVTDENFRYWMCLQFLPEAGVVDFDAFFDLWIALVEYKGDLKAGYFKFSDPD